MYDQNRISQETLSWIMDCAKNELVACLCEVEVEGYPVETWIEVARNQATLCRVVATAAVDAVSQQSWLDLAQQYEARILNIS